MEPGPPTGERRRDDGFVCDVRQGISAELGAEPTHEDAHRRSTVPLTIGAPHGRLGSARSQSTAFVSSRYACPKCPARFQTRQNQERHLLIHTGAKPYECEVCGARFSQPSHLKTHHKTHLAPSERGPRHLCRVCSATFVTAAVCRTHERIHTGDKPYECEQCPAAFAESGKLSRHRRSHLNPETNGRAHVCITCGTRFTKQAHLKRHAKSHSKDKIAVSSVPQLTSGVPQSLSGVPGVFLCDAGPQHGPIQAGIGDDREINGRDIGGCDVPSGKKDAAQSRGAEKDSIQAWGMDEYEDEIERRLDAALDARMLTDLAGGDYLDDFEAMFGGNSL